MDQEFPRNLPFPPPAAERKPVMLQPVAIPDHELIRCIGQGSYGAVWLARSSMGVFRAIKIVFRSSFEDSRPFQRELSGIRKFEPVSRSHEGFIDVLHVGINEAEGYFYYVMELGDDEQSGTKIDPQVYTPKTLAREISGRRRLPVKDCLKLGLALSDALAELHRYELVHRDIKPSNIIFVNGVPKLADIGLVAGANEARSYVGTEGFIPPEGPGTAQADVYSLGKVLYEASTGRDRQDFPELPTNWDDPAEHAQLVELNEVVLQACKAKLSDRYPSARAMHAHLLVLENGQSVRRLHQLERLVSNFKRLATAALVIIMLLAGIAFHFYREHRFSLERRQRQVGSDLANGAAYIDSSDYFRAYSYLLHGLALDEGDPARVANDRLRVGSVLAQCPRITQMFFAPGEINRLLMSPDGTKILVAEFGGKAQICDAMTGQALTPKFQHPGRIYSAAISPDGKWAATGGEGNCAILWNFTDGTLVRTQLHDANVNAVAFSKESRWLLTASDDRLARIWDLESDQPGPAVIFSNHMDTVLSAAFSRSGTKVATGSRNGELWIWDPLTGRPLHGPLLHRDWIYSLAFSPDGNTLLAACGDDVWVWDLSGPTPREMRPRLTHGDRVFCVEFSPDGQWILAGVLDGSAHLWGADTHQRLSPVSTLMHGSRVVSASFGPDGRRVLTSSNDGRGRVWDLASAGCAPEPQPGAFCEDASRFVVITNGVLQQYDAATWSPVGQPFSLPPGRQFKFDTQGKWMICIQTNLSAGAAAVSVEIRDGSTGELAGPALPIGSTNQIPVLALNPAGTLLCVAEGTNAQLYQVSSGAPVGASFGHSGRVGAIFFSPDGRLLGVRGSRWLKIWETATGREHCPEMLISSNEFGQVGFSPDSLLLSAVIQQKGFAAPPVTVWDTRTGKRLKDLQHRDGVLWTAFSPDSKRLVTASEDFTALIWEARTGRQLVAPLRHGDHVVYACFSDDGKWVLTASSDKTARVWDAETGDPLTPPFFHLQPVTWAHFVPGNRKFVTRDINGRYWSWNLIPENRSVQDLNAFAVLLTGDRIGLPGPAGKINEPMAELWRRLSSRYPSEFTVTPQQAAAWHDFTAGRFEAAHQWEAASFHLNQLLKFRPDDLQASNRLLRVNQGRVTEAASRK